MLCLGKDVKLWKDLENWDFVYAGDPEDLRFIIVLHWSCRRSGVWKRELRARSIPEESRSCRSTGMAIRQKADT